MCVQTTSCLVIPDIGVPYGTAHVHQQPSGTNLCYKFSAKWIWMEVLGKQSAGSF